MFSAMMASEGRSEEKFRRAMFSVMNPTFGTGVASKTAPTAYAATAGMLYLYNNDTTNNKAWCLLDRLILRATQANTASTSWHLAFTKDSGNLYSSGGGEITSAIQNIGDRTTNPQNASYTQRTSAMKAYWGDLTLAAATAASKIVWRQQVNDVIFAADDQLDLFFGEAIGSQTATVFKTISLPPMWVAPGEGLLISDLSPGPQSQNPAFEYALTWVERPPANNE